MIPSSQLLLNFGESNGNRCGHIRTHAKQLIPPAHHKPLPFLLQKLLARARESFSNSSLLKSVNRHIFRAKRSEGKERNSLLAQAFIYKLDMQTGEVRQGCTLSQLAKLAGLSLSRAKESLAEFTSRGYVEVKQQRVFKNGRYYSLAPRYIIKTKFYLELGITSATLEHAQAKRTKWLKRQRFRAELDKRIKEVKTPIAAIQEQGEILNAIMEVFNVDIFTAGKIARGMAP